MNSRGIITFAIGGLAIAGAFVIVIWWNGILYDWITPPGKVVIWSYGFHSPEITVKKGSTVVWENLDPVPHNVRSGTPEYPADIFVSGLLYDRDKFQHAFNDVGRYEYYCVPHPLMRARITVVA